MGAWPVFKKDFASFYRSWVGVLATASFLFLAGIFFTLFLLGYSQISLEGASRAYQGLEGVSLTGFVIGGLILNLGIVFLFLAPLFSMRSLAEEKRSGTLELLYTYPLSDWEIVLGKYAALLAELAVLFLPTLTYLGVLRLLGVDLDEGIVLGGVVGFFLLGSAFLAMGLFFSSLTENQMIASAVTFVFLLALWIFEWITGFLPRPWGPRLAAFSPFVHFRDFSLGVLDLSDGTYFLALTVIFLFLSLRVVETRNWKG
jgi:ABC-2 type transport system permease protein